MVNHEEWWNFWDQQNVSLIPKFMDVKIRVCLSHTHIKLMDYCLIVVLRSYTTHKQVHRPVVPDMVFKFLSLKVIINQKPHKPATNKTLLYNQTFYQVSKFLHWIWIDPRKLLCCTNRAIQINTDIFLTLFWFHSLCKTILTPQNMIYPTQKKQT